MKAAKRTVGNDFHAAPRPFSSAFAKLKIFWDQKKHENIPPRLKRTDKSHGFLGETWNIPLEAIFQKSKGMFSSSV